MLKHKYTEAERRDIRDILQRQGEQSWDECENCPFTGIGAASTYHLVHYPDHRLRKVHQASGLG